MNDRVQEGAVRVPRRQAEKARGILRRAGILIDGLRPVQEDDYVLFPVGDPHGAARLLTAHGVDAVPGEASFPKYRRARRLETRVKGFHLVGDIAVFSKTAGVDVDEYRRAAESLIESNPRIKSVWLKVDTGGEYRVPRLLHLAGEPATETIAREYGLSFRVDIAKAYYNPRLASEHRRVALQVSDGEVVLDMFTGIGAFPVHIASLHRAEIVALDLNPHAAQLALENARLNEKKLQGTIHVFQGDARHAPHVLASTFHRIILNLPHASTSFAPQACRLLRRQGILHFYLIASTPGEAVEEVTRALHQAGCQALEDPRWRRVLDYSPSQAIYAVEVEARREGDPD